MGKEWYHLTGGLIRSSFSSSYSSNSKRGSSRGGGRADKETSSSSSTTTITTTGGGGGGGGGCMSAVFQLFDFHHQFNDHNLHHQPASLKFPKSSHSSFPDDGDPSAHALKGTVAPRNSLELESASPMPSSSIIRKDEHLLTPLAMQGIQVKTSTGDHRRVSSPEIISSPGTRTPTLVVRLMGLDLLPDSTSSSPRPSSTLDIAPSTRQSLRHDPRTPHHRWSAGRKSCSDIDSSNYNRSRSLPETPRVSLARRSDVDHRHRPSLQINKENTSRTVGDDFDLCMLLKKELRCSSKDGTARSRRHHVRQIVKQVKENVSRRVGMTDITNTIRSRSEEGSTKDQICKPKKPPRTSQVTEDSSPSCSPSFRFPDAIKIRNNHSPEVQSGLAKCTGDAMRTKPQRCSNAAHRSSCLKLGSLRDDDQVRRATARLAATELMRNKQEEPFVRASKNLRTNHHKNDTLVDKKCKRTSCGIGKFVGVTPTTIAVLPVKKDPSPPATKIPHKQVHGIQTSKHRSQLPAGTSQGYRHEATHVVVVRDKNDRPNGSITTGTATVTDKQVELQYVREILRCAGIEDDTQLSSFTSRFSSFHFLHTSILSNLRCSSSPHSIDDSGNASHHVLDHHCNWKLVFQLVDELLADLLKPYLNDKPWINTIQSYSIRTGLQLFDRLWAKIESFPRADCQVLEDIDMIIDGDLLQSELRSQGAFEEEGDGLVSELERDIWEDLVREVVTEEFPPRVLVVRETK